MNFGKQSQSSAFFEEQIEQQCQLCRQPDMATVIANALFYKHATPQDHLYMKHIDDILQNACSSQVIMYNQQQYEDDDTERMRRMYAQQEWSTKINMLSEYYKFHRDIPLIFDLRVSKILARHYDKLKKHDYKLVKKAIRQEKIRNGQQYSSITSIDNSSSMDLDSDVEIKSRYSNLLNSKEQIQESLKTQTNQMEESKLLMHMCEQIGQALDHQYSPLKFKKNDIIIGKPDSQNQKFDKYVANHAIKKSNSFKKKDFFMFIQERQKQNDQKNKKFDLNYDKFRRAGTEHRKSVQQLTKNSNLLFLKKSRKYAKQENNRNFNKIIKNMNKLNGDRAIGNTDSKNSSKTAIKTNNLQLYIPKTSTNNSITASANNSLAGGIKLTINANTGTNLNVNIFNNHFAKKEGLNTREVSVNNQFKTRRITIQSVNNNDLFSKRNKSASKFKTIEQIYRPSENKNSYQRSSMANLLANNNKRSKSVINLMASRRQSLSSNKPNTVTISSKELARIKNNVQSGSNIGLNRRYEMNQNGNQNQNHNIYGGVIVNSQSANNLNRKSHSQYENFYKRDRYKMIKAEGGRFGKAMENQFEDNLIGVKISKGSKQKTSKITIQQLLKDKLVNQAINFHSGHKHTKI